MCIIRLLNFIIFILKIIHNRYNSIHNILRVYEKRVYEKRLKLSEFNFHKIYYWKRQKALNMIKSQINN